ncbi:GtrA family protein [Cellulomonas iranensis]|uniref:GtrA family protein n=1 Tax=Cellulomonas iranensis TaxID=76862 RepID=UPI0013D89B6F|nr:GtrA family protein [Cellulomonas iranensis]
MAEPVTSGRAAPTGRRSLVLYVLVGGLSYVVDAGLLVLVTGPLGGPVWLGTTVGFWTSVVVNFLLNRAVFSQGDASSVSHGVRYGVLLGVNYLVTLLIVHVGTTWGLPPVVPKTVAVALTTCWNFVLYRVWVFR